MNFTNAFHVNGKLRIFVVLFLLIVSSFSCDKFLDAGSPIDKVSAKNVYSSGISSAGVLTGIYFDMQKDAGIAQGTSGISFISALSADEFDILPISLFRNLYENSDHADFWTPLYNFVYRSNTAIEGISSSTLLSNQVKRQLLGEAKFTRAFYYFYLVNLYGDVPLVVKSDFNVTATLPRSPKKDVYNQIVEDLLSADTLLSDQFLDYDAISPSTQRLRPTKWAAYALLARTYLYMEKWPEAEAAATKVIDYKSLFDTVPLESVFLMNSKEAIWQLQPISTDGSYFHTQEAKLYVLTDGPDFSNYPVWLNNNFINSFESGDRRRTSWIGVDTVDNISYPFPYKYKLYNRNDARDEYLMVLRLAEQYLIRAESRIENNDIEDGKNDINLIRSRAGLPPLILTDKQELLSAILHERNEEFFTEWGHRWFDLKRVGKIDSVMKAITVYKGGGWQSYKQLYPIPVRDLLYNHNLVQNTGYPSL
jgi:starch-binding outer membrane protein, SusD/RagB family